MKLYALFVITFILMLGSIAQIQAQTSRSEASKQKKDLREFLRYQRHYQQVLLKIQDDLLEKDDSLQGLYSESVIAETMYLEANEAYETLEAQKLAQVPEANATQATVLKFQQSLRKAGQSPQYYQAQLRNLSAARSRLAALRDSLKEDEEVKVAFDQVDALEKKYLADARNFEDLMAKALANHPQAQTTKLLLNSCAQISQLLQRIVTSQDKALMPELEKRWGALVQLLHSKGTAQEKIFLAQLVKRLGEIKKGQ